MNLNDSDESFNPQSAQHLTASYKMIDRKSINKLIKKAWKENNISSFVLNTVLADGLALLGASKSAYAMMTELYPL